MSVPRATKSFLAKAVLSQDTTSARVDILAKYAGFFRGLRASPSHEVSFMANFVSRDLRTMTGRNLRFLADESGLDPWTVAPAKLKEVLHIKEANVPDGETWRLPYLDKLLEQREAASYADCCKD